jgi:NAD(P)-dependent dehydrogenase (short-subunit alcohol dehydrogenase family)
MQEADYAIGLEDKLMGQVNLVLIGREYVSEGGSFTLTTGVLDRDPIRQGTSASMVNGAINAFVRAAAIEMPRGQRINAVSPGVIEEAIAKEGFTLTPDPMPEEVIFIRSDQYSFVKQGVPSVFLVPGFTAADPDGDGEKLWREFLRTHYHQPSDDLTRPVDWPSAVRFARANVRIGYAIAEEEERPTWNEGDFFGDKFGR